MAHTKEKTKPHKARKFLFDQNCFDDDYVEQIIPEEPPPPTFSEAELEAARKQGFEQGRTKALAEAEASREKFIAGLLDIISQKFQTLFSSESSRESRYESEAVTLANAIFKKLFPALNEKEGLAEIEQIILSTLKNRRELPGIFIEIHTDYVEAIEKRLATITGDLKESGKITIIGKDNLRAGDCHMTWKDGGANRLADALAEEIHSHLEHMLADRPLLHDNKKETDINGENQ
ncbi:MAG: flagellar protein FlbE [Alphaproteobacteria bacterium CG_4_9_14_3_um_filter_47_13]|nr:MAG: flagellar protein FlbE [Alphaproteobacteria bacterium CG_4_9_14_3_um_filter_47_13]